MARTAPIIDSGRREVHSADLPITQPDDLVNDELTDHENVIVADEADLSAKAYLAELAFMSEPVTIVLHRGREKHSPNLHDFYVNGRPLWVPVEQETAVPRCYLEVIARSQPYEVETHVNKNEHKGMDAPVENKVVRHQSAKFPFTVVRDPNPKGPAWLAKVMREG